MAGSTASAPAQQSGMGQTGDKDLKSRDELVYERGLLF
jgi:hypothetical protein